MDPKEFRRVIASERTEAEQIRTFAALLGQESGLGSDGLTVVGGSALEVYTNGAYVSQDIDLLAENRTAVETALRRWGFRSEGMYWRSPDFPIVIQIVGRYDSGSRGRNQILSTPYGPVRLAAPENIVVTRLIEARHWKRPKAYAEAMLLVERQGASMDWEYIEVLAKQDGVLDLAKQAREKYSSRSSTTDLRKE